MSDTDETSKKYREQNPYLKEFEEMKRLSEEYRKARNDERYKTIQDRIEMRKCSGKKMETEKEEAHEEHEASESEEKESKEEEEK